MNQQYSEVFCTNKFNPNNKVQIAYLNLHKEKEGEKKQEKPPETGSKEVSLWLGMNCGTNFHNTEHV